MSNWLDLSARNLRGQCEVSEPESLDRRRKLVEFGVDSLMAIDFRNRLSDVLRLSTALHATLIYEHPTIEAIAEYLDDLVVPSAPAEKSAAAPQDEARTKELQEMSDEEAEAQLLKRLQSL